MLNQCNVKDPLSHSKWRRDRWTTYRKFSNVPSYLSYRWRPSSWPSCRRDIWRCTETFEDGRTNIIWCIISMHSELFVSYKQSFRKVNFSQNSKNFDTSLYDGCCYFSYSSYIWHWLRRKSHSQLKTKFLL